MPLLLLTSLQRLHYPVPYADFVAYWKEAERRGLAPWKWIVQFPLHKSEVNWSRSPVLVFNKNTPEWEQFGLDYLFELIDFEDIVIDVQATGEYDADRNNFQLTAGNKCGQCNIRQCPFTGVNMPYQQFGLLHEKLGRILTYFMAHTCRGFQAGDVMHLKDAMVDRPDIALRMINAAWTPGSFIDAVSLIAYFPDGYRLTSLGSVAESPQRPVRDTVAQVRRQRKQGAHFDTNNCPWLSQVCTFSKGQRVQVAPNKSAICRTAAIGIMRKACTDAFSNLMAVMHMACLPREYYKTIPSHLLIHTPDYDPLASQYWSRLFREEKTVIWNRAILTHTLSSSKVIDVCGPFMLMLRKLGRRFNLNKLQQAELHACSFNNSALHYCVLVGLAWEADGAIPDRTGSGSLYDEMVHACRLMFGQFGDGTFHRYQNGFKVLPRRSVRKLMHLCFEIERICRSQEFLKLVDEGDLYEASELVWKFCKEQGKKKKGGSETDDAPIAGGKGMNVSLFVWCLAMNPNFEVPLFLTSFCPLPDHKKKEYSEWNIFNKRNRDRIFRKTGIYLGLPLMSLEDFICECVRKANIMCVHFPGMPLLVIRQDVIHIYSWGKSDSPEVFSKFGDQSDVSTLIADSLYWSDDFIAEDDIIMVKHAVMKPPITGLSDSERWLCSNFGLESVTYTAKQLREFNLEKATANKRKLTEEFRSSAACEQILGQLFAEIHDFSFQSVRIAHEIFTENTRLLKKVGSIPTLRPELSVKIGKSKSKKDSSVSLLRELYKEREQKVHSQEIQNFNKLVLAHKGWSESEIEMHKVWSLEELFHEYMPEKDVPVNTPRVSSPPDDFRAESHMWSDIPGILNGPGKRSNEIGVNTNSDGQPMPTPGSRRGIVVTPSQKAKKTRYSSSAEETSSPFLSFSKGKTPVKGLSFNTIWLSMEGSFQLGAMELEQLIQCAFRKSRGKDFTYSVRAEELGEGSGCYHSAATLGTEEHLLTKVPEHDGLVRPRLIDLFPVPGISESNNEVTNKNIKTARIYARLCIIFLLMDSTDRAELISSIFKRKAYQDRQCLRVTLQPKRKGKSGKTGVRSDEATILFHLLVSSKKVYALLGSQCNQAKTKEELEVGGFLMYMGTL